MVVGRLPCCGLGAHARRDVGVAMKDALPEIPALDTRQFAEAVRWCDTLQALVGVKEATQLPSFRHMVFLIRLTRALASKIKTGDLPKPPPPPPPKPSVPAPRPLNGLDPALVAAVEATTRQFLRECSQSVVFNADPLVIEEPV